MVVMYDVGNYVKRVEVDQQKADVYEQKDRIREAEYRLHVVTWAEVQGIALDLKNENLEKGICKRQSQQRKLLPCAAMLTLIAKIGHPQRHHAQRGNEQKRVRGNGINVLKTAWLNPTTG